MAGRLRFIGLGFLICVLCLLSGGCSETEQRKTELLGRIDHGSGNPDIHFELGQIYETERKWELSASHYDIAFGSNPAQKDAQAMRVKSLKDGGDAARAKSNADTFINQVNHSAIESLQLAMAFQKAGLDDSALACYMQALKLMPNSSRTNRQIGYYYLLHNDNDNAKTYLMRSVQINPAQNDVASDLGRLGVPMNVPPKKK